MHVSVTPLGSSSGDAAGAAADVIAYLEGRGQDRGGQDPGRSPDLPDHDETSEVLGYYADAMAAPGIWMGTGLTGVRPDGMIDSRHLEAVLLGRNPYTGEQLLTANGSAQRAHSDDVRTALRGPDSDVLTLPEAADALGVSASYLRQQVTATAKARELNARQQAAGEELSPLPSSYLDASQARPGAPWEVTRGELRRFVAEREAPSVVIAYDITFSAPKSVSILWATASPAQQVAIETALTESVRAGMAYLEGHAAHVRVSVPNADGKGHHLERQDAKGLVAGAYMHDTSRALDPQLHYHVVVANMAEGPDGKVRALDGRSLFLHAKTAGYLAAAELRHRMSIELGVAWQPAARGLADIDGVPREAIVEMSQRSQEIDRHVEGMDDNHPASARGRQVAAYDTRAPKQGAVDPDSLRPSWEARLGGAGLDRRAIEACYGRQRGPALVAQDEVDKLFEAMSGPRGVTEHASTFDRRDVLQHVAEWAGDRLSASQVADVADSWLTRREIVRLNVDRRDARAADAIRREDGRAVPSIAVNDLYTTEQMVAVESAIANAYERGRHAGAARVEPALVEQTLARWPHLSQEQADMVRAITTSGRRIQLMRGDAGAGKTTALEAAARAWEAAGYTVIGTAVQGTAAEIIGDTVKVPHMTLASFLTRAQMGDSSIGERTVALVDECSALGNRQLHQLGRVLEQTGAVAVLAGDPRQHTAVAAGGAWRALLDRYPDEVPAITKVWRQRGEDIGDVREALQLWRADRVPEAIDLLRSHGRLTEYASRDELLDNKAREWYADRARHLAQPTEFAESSVMTPLHRDRRELNARIRELLKADGTLTGPVLRAGDLEFQRGDQVIALEQDRELRPAGSAKRGDFVRTAERGVVIEVNLSRPGDAGSVLVDFERRGEVLVPMEYLTRRLDRGIHGALSHAYAVTTNAAQGDTYGAARGAGAETIDPKALYVAVTRGTHDLSVGVVAERVIRQEATDDPRMPRLERETDALATVAANAAADREELLATELDPAAGRVAALTASHGLRDLDRLAVSASPDAGPAGAARRQVEAAVATQARLHPAPELVARLGPRPPEGPGRTPWDDAVGRVAVYRARYSSEPVPGGAYGTWALGPVPAHPAPRDAYDAALRSLLTAEEASLVARSPQELSAERRALRIALAPPSPTARDDAVRARESAAARLTGAERAVAAAEAALDRVAHPALRRANPVKVRAAEQALTLAGERRSEAADELRRATERERALAPDAQTAAQLPLRQRLDLVEGAVTAKAREAIATPAPYLTTALGPRPRDAAQRGRWDQAALGIERWRHAELGLGPEAGPLGADGLDAALGPVPGDDWLALQREAVVKAMPVEFQPARTVERALEGPALSLD